MNASASNLAPVHVTCLGAQTQEKSHWSAVVKKLAEKFSKKFIWCLVLRTITNQFL